MDSFKKEIWSFTFCDKSYSGFIIKSVTSKTLNISSYHPIGHILHIFRNPSSPAYSEISLDEKKLIAQQILEKRIFPSVETVVQTHSKTYLDDALKLPDLQLLAGKNDFVTTVVENHCRLKLDYQRCYYNIRRQTLHSSVIKTVQNVVDAGKYKSVTVFDAFAGIGPFLVPLKQSKKTNLHVLGNDLKRLYYNEINDAMVLFCTKNCETSEKNKLC